MNADFLSPPRRLALLGACVAAALLGSFAFLASEMLEAETAPFDDAVMHLLRGGDGAAPPGPAWLQESVRDITSLGSFSVVGLFSLIVVLYLSLHRQRRAALFVAFAVASGSVLSFVLKYVIDRPRPDIQSGIRVFTSSFPSGHATVSAVVYLTLGALLAYISPSRRLSVFFLATAVCLTLLVGLSRIYLGLHYPTDVVAGWALGCAWALLCWVGVNLRGAVIVLERAEAEK